MNSSDSPRPEAKSGGPGGIYGISLPVSQSVLLEAQRLVSDPKVRKEEIHAVVCQDPSIALEVLKVSNSMMFSAGRPPFTSIKCAI